MPWGSDYFLKLIKYSYNDAIELKISSDNATRNASQYFELFIGEDSLSSIRIKMALTNCRNDISDEVLFDSILFFIIDYKKNIYLYSFQEQEKLKEIILKIIPVALELAKTIKPYVKYDKIKKYFSLTDLWINYEDYDGKALNLVGFANSIKKIFSQDIMMCKII